MLSKNKRTSLKLIAAPESKSSETAEKYAKKLLDKYVPCVEWDIVDANKIACVFQIGNWHGLFSSIDVVISAVENIGKLPGVRMTDLGGFEEGGFKQQRSVPMFD